MFTVKNKNVISSLSRKTGVGC